MAAFDGRGDPVRVPPRRHDRVRSPHAEPLLGLARDEAIPLGERDQGDAARRVPQPHLRARPRPEGVRPCPARPDDPHLRQRRREPGPRDRRHGSPPPRRLPRGHAPVHARGRLVGHERDRRGRPDPLLPPDRPPHPPAAPRVRTAPAANDHPRAALGDRARATLGLAALLQRRLGIGDRLGRSPGRAAHARPPAGLRGDPDLDGRQPRVRRGDTARDRRPPPGRTRSAQAVP